MRRIFAILLCVVLMLALVACANGNSGSGNSNSGDTTTNTITTQKDEQSSLENETNDVENTESSTTNTGNKDKENVLIENKDTDDKNTTTSKPSTSTDKKDDDKPTSSNTTPSTSTKPTETSKPSTDKPTSTTTPTCKHTNTYLKNQSAASCANNGYTGDTYCEDCGKKISSGSVITATGHIRLEIRGQKDATTSSIGFTGDTYCKDCGKLVSAGTIIPKLPDDNIGKFKFTLADGEVVWVKELVEIRQYTMKKATRSTSHQYEALEKEILRLCNVERKKAGLSELTWYEDAYYFTKTRANECFTTLAHQRPNGKDWDTVYTDAGVIMFNYWGENIYGSFGQDTTDGLVERAMNGWMNSPGHKANILNPNFKEISISIVKNGDEIIIVQNFFG